jgi:type IV pilus assembly protein PilX
MKFAMNHRPQKNTSALPQHGTKILPRKGAQTGAALVVGLIFLVVLTLLGITALKTGILEERMAGNSRDANIAFQAAEAALRDAENDIVGHLPNGNALANLRPSGRIQGMVGADAACDYGLCCNLSASGLSCTEPPTPVYLSPGFSGTNTPSIAYGQITGAAPAIGGATNPLANQPRYLIEPFLLGGDGHSYYRITARGFGVNPNTQVTLQELYKE